MNLKWNEGTGPATTMELADLIEKEGRLLVGKLWFPDGRCLWGVICDASESHLKFNRVLHSSDCGTLDSARLSVSDNDSFIGTPEERCAEMVKRLRAIP